MPGICPNCVELVQEGDSCPRCHGPLISVSHWSQNRQNFLSDPNDLSAPVEDPNQIKLPFDPPIPSPQSHVGLDSEALFQQVGQANHQDANTSQDPPVPHYALKFLLGAFSGAAAFISLLYLVYSIKGG